jgi:hypothetical protein
VFNIQLLGFLIPNIFKEKDEIADNWHIEASLPKTKSQSALKMSVALNAVLRQFDTDLQLAEATLKDAGSFHFKEA